VIYRIEVESSLEREEISEELILVAHESYPTVSSFSKIKYVIMVNTALVTGCAGFIGSHLTERLIKDGNIVFGIDCFRDYYDAEIKEQNIARVIKHPNFTLIRSDISSMSSFPDVDYVFHQAAQAGVRSSWGNRFDQYLLDNIAITQRLLEYYKDKKSIRKFVYASSSSVYGNAPVYPVSEETKPQPISPYGVTKLAAEHLCYLYYSNYHLPIVSLRYFTVYGPRQRPDMAIYKFMRSIIDGTEITLYGDGTNMRDFTYVDDIIEANLCAAEIGRVGMVYNIGGGECIAIADLIHRIESILGNKASLHKFPAQYGDVRETWADTQLARRELMWQPETTLNQGLKKMADWLRK